MIRLRNRILHRTLITLTALVSMLFVVSSCGTPSQSASNQENSTQKNSGNVVIFTPADGLALMRHKPLSTWDTLVPELVKDLKTKGFSDNSIVTKTSSSLEQQSQDVQDYVVNLLTPLRLENQNNKSKLDFEKANAKIKKQLSKTTIVIAPWANKNGNNNYGDYTTLPDTSGDEEVKDDQKTSQNKEDKSENSSKNNSENSSENSSETNTIRAEKRLASSLLLAKKAGIHVVMLSRFVPGFQPDVLFHLSDAKSIGETQAATLAQKLALDRATRENPRYIEILLPCHNQKNTDSQIVSFKNSNSRTSQDNNSDNNGNNSANNSLNKTENNTENDETHDFKDDFAKEAFAGMWKVLRPYFASGTLLTTSGKLHANSTEKDWANVAFDADDADSVKEELTKRITHKNNLLSKTPMRVDGIIALDDQVALQTVQTLSDLGYEGSAANINPSFTLPDVIGNFIGKRNLTRRPVPAPRSKTNNDEEKSKNQQNKAEDQDASRAKQWPAITGYGAYKNIMPNIVSGKQWMTTIEHQTQIAHDITSTCYSLNMYGKLDKKIATTQTTLAKGVTVPTINEQLLAVSATNLKARLIDPGYISLADAGL